MNDSSIPPIDVGVDPLKIEYRPIDSLKPAKRNARTHSKKQIAQLAAAIRQFRVLTPLLVNSDDTVVAGHGRLAAAKLLGMTEVPVVRLSHLTQEELQAFALADNRIAELAGWDEDALRIDFEELQALELNFDPEITGFSTTQIDLLLDGRTDRRKSEESIPEVSAGPVWIEPDDLWVLGDHRLYCGDCPAFVEL